MRISKSERREISHSNESGNPSPRQTVYQSTGCHPERSEGSPQFPMPQRLTNNCRDPSLRSGWHNRA